MSRWALIAHVVIFIGDRETNQSHTDAVPIPRGVITSRGLSLFVMHDFNGLMAPLNLKGSSSVLFMPQFVGVLLDSVVNITYMSGAWWAQPCEMIRIVGPRRLSRQVVRGVLVPV